MSTSSSNEKFFTGDTIIGSRSHGNRLARRARSFKEDFLEIISQMRSPGGSVIRSASPQKNHMKQNDFIDKNLNKNSVEDLDCNIKQVFLALKHFRDVINKNKLEMLPGNGTIVLDTVTAIHVLLKQYGLNEQSSTLVSTTNQVYQSVAQLVKLCDDYLLVGEKAFEKENVTEIVNSVEFAIQNLVSLIKDKISTKDCSQQLLIDVPPITVKCKSKILSATSNLDFCQRSSLPDIPLTPREREILEKTSAIALERHSQSIENILEDSPPPKPPYPDRISTNSFPPPLPPKMRQKNSNNLTIAKNNMEYLSLRSRSLEDSSSQLSTSTGSVDSVLNHCRDENITNFVDHNCNNNHNQRNSNEKNYCHIKDESRLEQESFFWDYSFSSEENLQANVHSSKKVAIEILESPFLTGNSSNKVDDSDSSVLLLPSERSLCQSFSTSRHLNSSAVSQQNYTEQESHHAEKKIISTVESGSIQKFKLLNLGSCSDHVVCQKNISSKAFTEQFSYQPQSNKCCNCETSNNDTKDSIHINKMEHTLLEPEVANNVIKRTYCNTKCTVFPRQSALPVEGQPPPLPPKKKHMFQSVAFSVMAYMEMFGNASHANANEFLRHSVHAYNLLQSEWQQHQRFLNSAQSCSFSTYYDSNQKISTITNGLKLEKKSLPPALPPKKRTRSNTNSPPTTPIHTSEDMIKGTEEKGNKQFLDITTNVECVRSDIPLTTPMPSSLFQNSGVINNSVTESNKIKKNGEVFLLDKLQVSEYLVFKKEEDEGPDLRGGHPDALVIHATKAQKNDFIYQEAFLTTYRTFLSPLELIQKLCYRYEKFSSSQDSSKQRAARESFSLLVRVVSDLTSTDLEQVILQTLMEFVQQLLCRGDLTMAKALRVIMLNKYEAKRLYLNFNVLLPAHNISTRQFLLLDFKSEQIAEQMTLLDAELFSKIEIPEVLNWAQEQNEERSPNLTKFTEHFNKMSYWARSKILEQNDAKDREKYVIKFIKVMKYLRKINNFNSYLALLSALDSAPIRRLEWQKNITEGLKEYCALIDSSSSFRAYRLALAETHPPCIPYIGLVLQDLTFVHIGNTNTLPTGEVNFSKRWQQFNIVENMKRFKKVSYPYKKSDKIIAFFNGFDDSLSEEAMWQISEKIKPRGGKKA